MFQSVVVFLLLCGFGDVMLVSVRSSIHSPNSSMTLVYSLVALHEVMIVLHTVGLSVLFLRTFLFTWGVLRRILRVTRVGFILLVLRLFLIAFPCVYRELLIQRQKYPRAWSDPVYVVLVIVDIISCLAYQLSGIHLISFLSDKSLYPMANKQQWSTMAEGATAKHKGTESGNPPLGVRRQSEVCTGSSSKTMSGTSARQFAHQSGDNQTPIRVPCYPSPTAHSGMRTAGSTPSAGLGHISPLQLKQPVSSPAVIRELAALHNFAAAMYKKKVSHPHGNPLVIGLDADTSGDGERRSRQPRMDDSTSSSDAPHPMQYSSENQRGSWPPALPAVTRESADGFSHVIRGEEASSNTSPCLRSSHNPMDSLADQWKKRVVRKGTQVSFTLDHHLPSGQCEALTSPSPPCIPSGRRGDVQRSTDEEVRTGGSAEASYHPLKIDPK